MSNYGSASSFLLKVTVTSNGCPCFFYRRARSPAREETKIFKTLKSLRKSTPQDLRILFGPFRGARVYLNPSNSKRKIFGLYEYCLNPWLTSKAKGKEFIFDVGSNTGYDLFGLVHVASGKAKRAIEAFGFEPDAKRFPELTTPLTWPEYSHCKIQIIDCLV